MIGENMSKQLNIEGVKAARAPVPDGRLCELALGLGALLALDKVTEEIRKMEKEHLLVPGLTLALAVAEKHVAQAQDANSRLVLILASSAGMEVEHMATLVELREDGGLDLVSYKAEEESEGGAA